VAREILAHRLLTVHNLYFYQTLVAEARRAIVLGCYPAWADAALARLGRDELESDPARSSGGNGL
jgi:queuine/archaeosine tRNA-ribosyltransferase